MTFFEWLDTKITNENSTFYKFANQIHQRDNKPDTNNFKDLKSYFSEMGSDELESFLFCWKQYRHSTDK